MATVTYAHHVRGQRQFVAVSKETLYYPNVQSAGELGEGENPELNIASPTLKWSVRNLLNTDYFHADLSMVKVILLKVYYSLSPCIGNYLGRNGVFERLQELNGGSWGWVRLTGCITNAFKNKSRQPKESARTKEATSGLPKGRNSYGNRVIVVPA